MKFRLSESVLMAEARLFNEKPVADSAAGNALEYFWPEN